MPITPFHFGPGALLKAAVGRHFSFTVFCFAQVVTDAEVLVYMARGGGTLHGPLHTYIGALGVTVFSVLAGRPLCTAFLQWWSRDPHLPLKIYFREPPLISWHAATMGALLGSLSHVVLDSVMHTDLHPFSPFDDDNSLLGLVGPGALHLLCLVLGVAGAALCARFRRRS